MLVVHSLLKLHKSRIWNATLQLHHANPRPSFITPDVKALSYGTFSDLPISTTEQIKEISKQALKMLSLSFQQISEPTFDDENKDYVSKGMFESVFCAMHYILSYSEIYIRGKEEMTYSFQKLCRDESLNNISAVVFNLWNEFVIKSLEDCDIEKLIANGKMFILSGCNKFF